MSSTLHCIGPRPAAALLREPVAALRFTLPPALVLRAQAGRYAPALHKVGLEVDEAGTVTIGGYDMMLDTALPLLVDQAARFLVTLAEARMAPQSFAGEFVAGERWKERCLIAVGARVAIAQAARGMVVR